jgi:hypothetical protein
MFAQAKPPTLDEIINPDHGTFQLRQAAKEEFYEFIGKTHKALVISEAKEMGSPTSIAVFCRIDVSIILDEGGKASYFVNEVERTSTTSLWSKCLNMPLNTLATTFTYEMHKWLSFVSQDF